MTFNFIQPNAENAIKTILFNYNVMKVKLLAQHLRQLFYRQVELCLH